MQTLLKKVAVDGCDGNGIASERLYERIARIARKIIPYPRNRDLSLSPRNLDYLGIACRTVVAG
jgi:hypothetical protein